MVYNLSLLYPGARVAASEIKGFWVSAVSLRGTRGTGYFYNEARVTVPISPTMLQ